MLDYRVQNEREATRVSMDLVAIPLHLQRRGITEV